MSEVLNSAVETAAVVTPALRDNVIVRKITALPTDASGAVIPTQVAISGAALGTNPNASKPEKLVCTVGQFVVLQQRLRTQGYKLDANKQRVKNLAGTAWEMEALKEPKLYEWVLGVYATESEAFAAINGAVIESQAADVRQALSTAVAKKGVNEQLAAAMKEHGFASKEELLAFAMY